MDLILRRRILMLPADNNRYIRDGLVLWMDGIEKGSVPGAWVDQAKGEVFTASPNVAFNDNNIELDGSSSLQNTSFVPISENVGTIEVCFETNQKTGIIFMPQNAGIAFGIFNNSSYIWKAGSGETKAKYKIIESPTTISICLESAVGNGYALKPDTSKDLWVGASNTTSYIGCRSSGTFFAGKIYAIRIYNRHLTENEMLHNQKIDNKRFKLGLNL